MCFRAINIELLERRTTDMSLRVAVDCIQLLWWMNERVRSFGGMTQTGKFRSTRRKVCSSSILSTTNPTRNDRGSKQDIPSYTSQTSTLTHGTATMTRYFSTIKIPMFQEMSAPSRQTLSMYREMKDTLCTVIYQ